MSFEALHAWITTRVGVDLSQAALLAGALQISVVVLTLLLAVVARRLTVDMSDRLMERIDLRFRPPRVMLALRPLVLPALWWILLVIATRGALVFSYSNRLLGIAATLVALWIVIHATSVLVRDPLLSRFIATTAWTIAALDILGLLGVIATALDSFALHIGSLRISALAVIKGALLLAILLWLATAVSHLVKGRITKVSGLTPSAQVLIANLLRITLVVLAVMVALNSVGIDVTALAVFSGAVGLGIGFGLQKIVSNLISGVILLLDKSIKPGDTIEIEKTFGWITSLGARYVSVRSRDGKEYLIPNEDLITHRVINWSYSTRLVRLDVEFGVAYESDLHLVRRLAVDAAHQAKRVLRDPPPICHVTGFGDSAITLLLRFWIDDPANGVTNIKGEVYLALWDLFRAHGIVIPFPQREVRLRQDNR